MSPLSFNYFVNKTVPYTLGNAHLKRCLLLVLTMECSGASSSQPKPTRTCSRLKVIANLLTTLCTGAFRNELKDKPATTVYTAFGVSINQQFMKELLKMLFGDSRVISGRPEEQKVLQWRMKKASTLFFCGACAL